MSTSTSREDDVATTRMRIPLEGISRGETLIRGVYDELSLCLARTLGEAAIRRASHVDIAADLRPAARDWLRQHAVDADLSPLNWWADMLPVNGPVLGPFCTREIALKHEAAWLEQHGLPIPQSHKA